MFALYFVPKNLISRLVGFIVSFVWPKPIASFLIRKFANYYRINLSEAELAIDAYKSIGDFFIRKLKSEARPLGEGVILHPADAQITQLGEIRQGKIIQAKGISYSSADLLGDGERAKLFDGGLFITYYLCPTDYHRVHSPMDGHITRAHHIAGQLWPVNDWSTARIPNLFAINERLVVEIKTDYGPVMLVMVGATNVGKMTASFDGEIITNNARGKGVKKVYEHPLVIKKGDEIGIFNMGSTVVMLYPPTIRKQLSDWEAFKNQQTKVKSTLL